MPSRKPVRHPNPPAKGPARLRVDHTPETPAERALSLLLRLETGGPNLLTAAEELDRLQGVLAREDRLTEVRERVSDLCTAWQSHSLRGERARSWLVLTGGFGLRDLEPRVAALARDSGQSIPLRTLSCEVLASLGGAAATDALLDLVLLPGASQVRVAAAAGVAQLGNRALAPTLRQLLEAEVPAPVFRAVSEALDRLA